MKKYKHKKLDWVAEEGEVKSSLFYITTKAGGWTLLPRELVEDSTDWIEIKEKTYEILSYKYCNALYYLTTEISKEYNNNPMYKATTKQWGFLTITDFEAHPDLVKIYSIRRLSDGEIFTVGDNIITHENKIFSIESIKLNDSWAGGLCFTLDEDNAESLEVLKKNKEPLLVTEDGVGIYDHKTMYWRVDSNFYSYVDTYVKPVEHLKYFSTKEKAEEHILMNKPCLSLKEVFDILPSNTGWYPDKIKEVAKSKL